jgi:hypothetical protein
MLFSLLFAGCSTTGSDDLWKAAYTVGDTGPAGGLVFYVSETGFAVDGLTGTFHYLEASPENVSSPSYNWGGSGTVCGIIATGIGKGYANTNTLRTHTHSNTNPNQADHPVAKAVWNYSVTNGGTVYDDWWLPSKEELNELYTVYASLSDKSDWGTENKRFYWTSTEYDAENAWIQFFAPYTGSSNTYSIGEQVYWPKGWEPRIRAVRAF